MIPFVQWGVSDYDQTSGWFQMYNVHHVNMALESSTCEVWDICSRNPINHPFHIHVNPFMVMNISIAFPDVLSCRLGAQLMQSRIAAPLFRFNKPYEWRDTAWVPPCGCLTVKQCYDARSPRVKGGPEVGAEGKFIFHCHFLTHEDTGLIHNVMLRRSPYIRQHRATNLFPGATIPADASGCDWSDPCGLLPENWNCALCLSHVMIRTGCLCQVPLPGLLYHPLGAEDKRRKEFLALAARPSVAAVVTAAAAGAVVAAASLAAIGRLQRARAAPVHVRLATVREAGPLD